MHRWKPRETEKTSKILKLTPFFAVLLTHIESCGILSVLYKWQGENRISLKRGSYKLDQEFLLYSASESERASFKLSILIGTENWFNLNAWKWDYQFSYESHFPYLWRISFSLTHICFLLNFFLPFLLSHFSKSTLYNLFLISIIGISQWQSQRWI